MEPTVEAVDAQSLSFEDAMAALEGIVQALEAGDATLEHSLDLFEQGVSLSRRCMGLLNAAEGRVEQLVQGVDGELRAEALRPGPD